MDILECFYYSEKNRLDGTNGWANLSNNEQKSRIGIKIWYLALIERHNNNQELKNGTLLFFLPELDRQNEPEVGPPIQSKLSMLLEYNKYDELFEHSAIAGSQIY